MHLYLVHCGFYDPEICQGLYEAHANFFVVAESIEAARLQAKQLPEVKQKRMHIDGLQMISAVDGYAIELAHKSEFEGKTIMSVHTFRELAPTPKTQ